MSRGWKIALGAAVLIAVVMASSGLLLRWLISGPLGDAVRQRAAQILPVGVDIESIDFDLPSWFTLRPAIAIHGLRVSNPPGFSAEPLFAAGRVYARCELRSLFRDEIHVTALEFSAPKLRVEEGAEGTTNIDALLAALEERDGEPEEQPSGDQEQSSAKTFRMDSFLIEDGEVDYFSGGRPGLAVRGVRAAIRGYAPDSPVRFELAAHLFDEAAVALRFDGRAGPFTPLHAPADGSVTIDVRPGRLPPDFREEYLGAFLASPGDASRLAIAADISGDLLGTLSGAGMAEIEKLRLGKPEETQFPLNGESPVLLTLIDLMTAPSYQVVMPEARLSFGLGTWEGGIDVQYDGERVRGGSNGTVSGVKVEEVLGAFTSVKDAAYGDLRLRNYSLKFEGAGADEILASLRGNGRIELASGKFAVFDLLSTIQRHLDRALSGGQAEQGETSFVTFTTDFEVREQRVWTPNLLLQSDTAEIGGKGSFGFDQSLDFELSALVSGGMARAIGAAAGPDGTVRAAIPVRIGGSVDNPRVQPDIARLVRNVAATRVQGLLGRLFEGAQPEAEDNKQQEEEESAPRGSGLSGFLKGALRKAADQAAQPKQQ